MTPDQWYMIRLAASACIGFVGCGIFWTKNPTISKKADIGIFIFALVMFIFSFVLG